MAEFARIRNRGQPTGLWRAQFQGFLVGAAVDDSVSKPVIVVNPQGFHARPAHLFMKLAMSFQSQVEILKGNEVVNGKSILDLLTLGAGNGTTLTLRASGPDAQAAVEALAQLIEGGFGEAAPGVSPPENPA